MSKSSPASTATQLALMHGYVKGLRVAFDLMNKLPPTNEKRELRLELIRLMNEEENNGAGT